MPWTLRGRSNPIAGKVYALREGHQQLGRLDTLELPFPEGMLSRRHCELLVAGDDVRVTDLGSAYGTFINGARAVAGARLCEGDVLRVAELELVLEIDGERPRPLPLDKLTGLPRGQR